MKIKLMQCNSKKCMGTMTNHFIDPNSQRGVCGRCGEIAKEKEIDKFLKGFGLRSK